MSYLPPRAEKYLSPIRRPAAVQTAPGQEEYWLSVIIPPVGIILGIIAMSRSYTGPGLALWAVSFIGFWIVWPVLLFVVLPILVMMFGS